LNLRSEVIDKSEDKFLDFVRNIVNSTVESLKKNIYNVLEIRLV